MNKQSFICLDAIGSPTNYENFSPKSPLRGDTFVYSKCPITPYPFIFAAPEWEMPVHCDSPKIPRSSNTNKRVPDRLNQGCQTIWRTGLRKCFIMKKCFSDFILR